MEATNPIDDRIDYEQTPLDSDHNDVTEMTIAHEPDEYTEAGVTLDKGPRLELLICKSTNDYDIEFNKPVPYQRDQRVRASRYEDGFRYACKQYLVYARDPDYESIEELVTVVARRLADEAGDAACQR